ncbi:MAG: hypothetical protein A3G24_14720 [Betaproteobacteria bacterium RIFCSPLOWO2_12_FULL_62_13]|nr:MAG: hypothetical protein A3G24_14720 [Betaproteobacteria bacterium RIFCSPLOWO2_12_FULL_62_13]
MLFDYPLGYARRFKDDQPTEFSRHEKTAGVEVIGHESPVTPLMSPSGMVEIPRPRIGVRDRLLGNDSQRRFAVGFKPTSLKPVGLQPRVV